MINLGSVIVFHVSYLHRPSVKILKKFFSVGRLSLAIACALLPVGCLKQSQKPAVRISDLRQASTEREQISISLDRADFSSAVSDIDSMKRMRLVEIMANESQRTPYPEYRLFDIRKGSAYQLVGLKNADVLVAANDFIIYDPRMFATFVTLLSREQTGKIEIRRAGKPIELIIEIVN